MTVLERRGVFASPLRAVARADPAPAWATAAAVTIPLTLVLGWVTADALQPPTFSPTRQTMSVIAGHAGRHRWVMTAALLVVGGCYLLAAAGLRAVGGPARLGLAAAGIAGIGIACSPQPVTGSTTQHQVFTALGAVLITAWPLLAVRGGSWVPWAQRPPVTMIVGVVFASLTAWLAWQTVHGDQLGLTERTVASLEVGWPAVVALSVYAHRRRPAR